MYDYSQFQGQMSISGWIYYDLVVVVWFGGQKAPNNRFERYKKDVADFLEEFKIDNLFCTEEGSCTASLMEDCIPMQLYDL